MTTPVPGPLPPQRLASLDAYRGFVMFLMMAEVLRLCAVARAIPGSSFWHSFWETLCFHQSHAEWIGCSLHDLIQPSFSFMVGVALPFSIASRLARGQTRGRMILHALARALILIFLGIFLRSVHSSRTNFTFEDTLTQIGLGYFFLFLLGFRPRRDQWLAVSALLIGTWAAFALYQPPAGFDYAKAGVPRDWPHLMYGFEAHWNKNSNLAWAFDTWFLNLFPREKPFEYNGGGYATLSFLPTLGTMILGLLAGGVLHGGRSAWDKSRWLAIAGFAGLLAGAAIGWAGLCPVVKRIWTPSWTLYSGGWCFLLLAAFYIVIDIVLLRAWSFPLRVVGMNSIAAYCMAHLFDGFIGEALRTHLGSRPFQVFGAAYEPFLHGAAVLFTLWLILFWMHRRQIFLRI